MKVVFMKKGIIFGLLMLILGACEVRAEEAAENLLMVSEDEISEAIKKSLWSKGGLRLLIWNFWWADCLSNRKCSKS